MRQCAGEADSPAAGACKQLVTLIQQQGPVLYDHYSAARAVSCHVCPVYEPLLHCKLASIPVLAQPTGCAVCCQAPTHNFTHVHARLQVDNKSSTQVTLVEIKLHQRLHLMGESFLGQINKHIDVVRVASR